MTDPNRWNPSSKIQKSLYWPWRSKPPWSSTAARKWDLPTTTRAWKRRPQSHRLDYSPGRPWEEGLVRLGLDRCPLGTVRWHMNVVWSCWICDNLLYRMRKWAQPHAKDCNPTLSVPAEMGAKHWAQKRAMLRKGKGWFHKVSNFQLLFMSTSVQTKDSHLTFWFPTPSIFLQVALFHSYLQHSMCIWTAFSPFVFLLVDIYIDSITGLLWKHSMLSLIFGI